ncbi:ketose-bisphosphate aldolase [Candidatus Poribacteria bacterium]|nr:MAG: ketose-bisphosphate aldolase [Candidatus Poribacteria bacterium]
MALVTMKEMLEDAKRRRYAVGAFNVLNIESLQGILEAAVELKSPVIVNIAEVHFKYVDMEAMAPVVQRAAQLAPVPVALHLDHGLSLQTIVRAIRCGFTSVMFDGSMYPLEENIRLTKQIVEICHSVGVTVEAELGYVPGTESPRPNGTEAQPEFFTDPEEAERFVKETGVDALAVAVGTVHGLYKGEPKIDFDRLAEIARRTNIPLVLHGGSGISDEDFKRAIELGVCKVNVYTQMSIEAVNRIKRRLEREPELINFPELLLEAKAGIKDVVKRQMEVFGSAGKCESPSPLCNMCRACRLGRLRDREEAPQPASDERLIEVISKAIASALREWSHGD